VDRDQVIGSPHRGPWIALCAALVAALSLSCAAAAARATPITEFNKVIAGGAKLDGLTVGGDGNLWAVDDSGGTGIYKITRAGTITRIRVGLKPGSNPLAIEAGPLKSMWFLIGGANATPGLGRVSRSGQVMKIAPGTDGLDPGAIPFTMTEGPGGTVWFTDVGTPVAIGEIKSDGTVQEFPYPINTLDPAPDFDTEMTEGPGGNVYITDKGNKPGVVKVTPAGAITQFFISDPLGKPVAIAPGADGIVWFSDARSSTIDQLLPSGLIATFGEGNGLQPNAGPDANTAGPDGNQWFIDQVNQSNKIGRVTPFGAVTEFAVTGTPEDIVNRDGNLWAPQADPNGVDRVTPGGKVTDFTAGLRKGADLGETNITIGPDHNLWFIDKGKHNEVARLNVRAAGG
jgi:virginiamycin B lyase